MNSYTGNLVRAIRGPIVLITLGSLFALDQLGSLSFSRTWPVLIIVVGVMKLVERAIYPAPQVPQYVPGSQNPTMPGGGIPQ